MPQMVGAAAFLDFTIWFLLILVLACMLGGAIHDFISKRKRR